MNLQFSTKEEMTFSPNTHADHRQIQSIAEVIFRHNRGISFEVYCVHPN